MGAASDIRFENGQVTWKPHYWEYERETLELNDVIILKDDGNDLSRIDQLEIRELPFPCKPRNWLNRNPSFSDAADGLWPFPTEALNRLWRIPTTPSRWGFTMRSSR